MRLLVLSQTLHLKSKFCFHSHLALEADTIPITNFRPSFRGLANHRGQSLIEYLLLVAIMSIATLSVIKIVGQNVAAQYGNVARALQGGEVANQKQQMEKVDDTVTRKRDMSTFIGN